MCCEEKWCNKRGIVSKLNMIYLKEKKTAKQRDHRIKLTNIT